ncbi:MAG: DUF3291 domain-containing protein [Amphiplicatus sp.]
MHIAQLNVGTTAYDLDDPRMAGFVDNLDRVNAIAERSKGFVWRLKDEAGDATGIKVSDDPRFIVNMSVWETVEDLERFVFATVHRKFYARGEEWFHKMTTPRFVMWPVPVGHRPTVEEALSRLDKLTEEGPSDEAFGWERLAELKLWMSKRCA